MKQEDFNRKFEGTLKKHGFTWSLIKNVIYKHPNEFDFYVKQHSKRLIIREVTKCDGCSWNDGLPHSACYSCDD